MDTMDWDSLIQKHLDGQTNAEEAEALSSRIVDDPGIRARYLQAAQVHGALADEVLALDLEDEPKVVAASKEKNKPIRSSAWPQQLAAAIVAGAFVGLLGIGVAWAIGKPRAEVSSLNVAHGTFDSLLPGPIVRGFSSRFGEWSGDPVEVVEESDGNRRLRFMETGNVKGVPKGGASACNAFQFIDLAALRHQWHASDSDARQTLELSATFERKPSSIDEAFPKLRATLRIYLFEAAPETIAEGWPHVLADVITVGKKVVRLEPGETSGEISAVCLLEPESTVALITLGAGVGMESNTPIALGNYYADDVELTVTSSPKLPVRIVK
jgi:hypothetical protein